MKAMEARNERNLSEVSVKGHYFYINGEQFDLKNVP